MLLTRFDITGCLRSHADSLGCPISMCETCDPLRAACVREGGVYPYFLPYPADLANQLLHFPKYTSRAVTRMVERNAQEYTKLAKAFEAKDWAAAKVAEGKAEFAKVSGGGLQSNGCPDHSR